MTVSEKANHAGSFTLPVGPPMSKNISTLKSFFFFYFYVIKSVSSLGNPQFLVRGSRFFVFHADFKVLSRLPSTGVEEEAEEVEVEVEERDATRTSKGNTSLIETSSFVASCCFIDEGR